MSNFKLYLEKAQGKNIDVKEIVSLNENFKSYLQKKYIIQEKLDEKSLDLITKNPKPYIEKIKKYISNNKYIDFIIRLNPNKQIEISFKTDETIKNTKTGNEYVINITDDNFNEIYQIKEKEKIKLNLDSAKEIIGKSGQNVANLNSDFSASNLFYQIKQTSLYKFLQEYFLQIHKVHANFNGVGDILISNNKVELVIEKIDTGENDTGIKVKRIDNVEVAGVIVTIEKNQ